MDAAPVLEPTDGTLDQVALLVAGAIEGVVAFAGGIVWDDGSRPALDHEPAQVVAVVGCIRQAGDGRRQRLQQVPRDRSITTVSRGECEREHSAKTVDDKMDLGATPAT